jgi:hypothetical protein
LLPTIQRKQIEKPVMASIFRRYERIAQVANNLRGSAEFESAETS